jgi:hypothetical protein
MQEQAALCDWYDRMLTDYERIWEKVKIIMMSNNDKAKAYDRLMALLDHSTVDGVRISKSFNKPDHYFVEVLTTSGDEIDQACDPLPVALAAAFEKTEEYVRERDGDDE